MRLLQSLVLPLALGLCFVTNTAYSTITITGFERAYSRYDLTTKPVEVYAGNYGSCTADSYGVCNSCTGNTTTSTNRRPANCNPRSVQLSQKDLYITFTTTTAGTVFLKNSQSQAVPFYMVSPTSTTVGANTTVTIRATWDVLCKAIDSSFASCKDDNAKGSSLFSLGVEGDGTTDSVNLKVGAHFAPAANVEVDCVTGEGVCSFKLFPGDEKAYIREEPVAIAHASGLPLIELRFYYAISPSLTTCATGKTLINNNSSYVSLNLNTTTGSAETTGVLNGFSNDITYCFKAALVDQAGNVFGFLDDNDFNDSGIDGHRVTPSEVAGVLAEEFDCFIATAAYGSPLDEHVQTFREFRNKFLNTNTLGRKLVKLYYQYSPALAQEIHSHFILKLGAQILLWPLWLVAYMMLNPTWLAFSFSAFLGLAALTLLRRKIS